MNLRINRLYLSAHRGYSTLGILQYYHLLQTLWHFITTSRLLRQQNTKTIIQFGLYSTAYIQAIHQNYQETQPFAARMPSVLNAENPLEQQKACLFTKTEKSLTNKQLL